MELRKRINFRVVFGLVYVLLFGIYIVVGLQPAEASNYVISSKLMIPSISFSSDVTSLSLNGVRLDTPDSIVGSYSQSDNKTLLIGHESTVFYDLDDVKIGDEVIYGDKPYRIVKARLALKEAIDMDELLLPSETDTIVLMTCAGQDLGNGDATHRLIIFAEAE